MQKEWRSKPFPLSKDGKLSPLKFSYDGYILKISLNKPYKGGETYTVYIDYTAKPNELKVKGSAAITDAKGLYFINPKGEEKNKPTQMRLRKRLWMVHSHLLEAVIPLLRLTNSVIPTR